jgi:hypothetical protein
VADLKLVEAPSFRVTSSTAFRVIVTAPIGYTGP